MNKPAEKTDQTEERQGRKFYAPGHYTDISNEEYHSSFGYGSTSLKVLAEKTKIHLDYERNRKSAMTESLLKGQALHTLAMEPEKFDSEFAIRPDGLKKPTITQINAAKPSAKTLEQRNEWAQWLEELSGRIEITQSIYDSAHYMAEKLRSHPEAGLILEDGVAEQSIYYWYNPEDWDEKDDYRIMCKVRPDWIIPGHNVIFDLKSCRSAAFTAFMKQSESLGYNISAAMYLDGVNRCREFLEFAQVMAFSKFAWICVENEPPYEVAIYEVSPEDRERGRAIYHNLVRRLDTYNRSEWKGYGDFQDGQIIPTARMSELPTWGRNVV